MLIWKIVHRHLGAALPVLALNRLDDMHDKAIAAQTHTKR